MLRYSTTEARKHFSEIINKVKYEKIIVAVGRHNKNDVLIVPQPDIDTDDVPVSLMNAQSASFNFLAEEPDLYAFDDLKKRYV